MHNERDWREQLHLGCDRSAFHGSPPFSRLEGPNLWPVDPRFRRELSRYMEATAKLGESILARVGEALRLDGNSFAGIHDGGYLVMKLIGYHPQHEPLANRTGVAPHVDFSWLTLTLQDRPGLEVRAPNGQWLSVPHHDATLWVHSGELLQFATGDRYQATPHRVTNHSLTHMRVSVPLFLNPPLDTYVPVFQTRPLHPQLSRPVAEEHVHRVLPPGLPRRPFHFGAAEWQRKGLGFWCATCEPPSRTKA
jgi:isopenicillin N synthase-like dioxygenase